MSILLIEFKKAISDEAKSGSMHNSSINKYKKNVKWQNILHKLKFSK